MSGEWHSRAFPDGKDGSYGFGRAEGTTGDLTEMGFSHNFAK
jgi:hypothetical protein